MYAQRLSPSLGGLLMAVGGALVAVGAVLPWIDPANPKIPAGTDVPSLAIEGDKPFLLVAGSVQLVAGLLFMWQRPRFRLASVVAGAAALLAVALLVLASIDLQGHFKKPIDLTSVLDLAYWAAIVGAFMGLAGAWLAYRHKPPLTVPVARAEPPPLRTERARRWLGKNYLVAPALIYVVVITQVPFLLTIWYSLQKWNMLRPENSRFAGLQNYADIFAGNLRDQFINALFNTVVLTFSAVVLSLIVGLAYAELVNHRFPGRGIVRTMLITPFLVMPVVGALGWANPLLNPVFGVVDWVITSLGGPRIDFFSSYPLFSITIVVVWRWAPFMMLIMLAGMQALSDEVREAGRVDGASGAQEFRYIVLPHLRPFMQLCLLFGVIYILAEFDSIAMTTRGGPSQLTTTLPWLIYETAFTGFDIGHAAAMGVVLVAVTFIFATYLIRLLGRLMEGNQA